MTNYVNGNERFLRENSMNSARLARLATLVWLFDSAWLATLALLKDSLTYLLFTKTV